MRPPLFGLTAKVVWARTPGQMKGVFPRTMRKVTRELYIPEQYRAGIARITDTFRRNNFECYMVGGSVRDLVIGHEAYDFDFATNARPNDVMKLFKRVAPTGIKHGTVTLLIDGNTFEVTTYRSDGVYLDGRRPESVSFSDSLEEDVMRRDFTMNGLAYDLTAGEIIDYVDGLGDISRKMIRTIGSATDRLNEDGLRSYRACRLASKLNFTIDDPTLAAIHATLPIAELVSVERVRDEFVKLLQTIKPSVGIEYMRVTGLLDLFLPELTACFDVSQNKFHMYDIYYHCLYSCDAAIRSDVIIRLSALLHDIGKVPTRREGTEGDNVFYNHEVIGARMTKKIMRRLKFSNEEIERTVNLVYNHMFHYTNEWTDGAVRRFMRKVGVENLRDLFELRKADRKGNGSREGLPVPILELEKRIAKIIEAENAITVKDLEIDGYDIMSEFSIQPGPVIGKLLGELLEIVLDHPELNTKEYLLEKAREIFPVLNASIARHTDMRRRGEKVGEDEETL
jgi:tRNA nucleotidyltransferase (CCA-adding enzyme)